MKSTGDYYLSGDIMQESFTRYFEKYGEGQTNPSLLNVITRNTLVDGHRKPGRNPISFNEQEHSGINPENHLMVRDTCRRVLAAMKKLEKTERDILTLVVSSGLTYREIARITGTSEGNVKVMVHRARVKLKKMINAGDI
jgi:RNA polymerase sigma factor (sigma-70 family)